MKGAVTNAKPPNLSIGIELRISDILGAGSVTCHYGKKTKETQNLKLSKGTGCWLIISALRIKNQVIILSIQRVCKDKQIAPKRTEWFPLPAVSLRRWECWVVLISCAKHTPAKIISPYKVHWTLQKDFRRRKQKRLTISDQNKAWRFTTQISRVQRINLSFQTGFYVGVTPTWYFWFKVFD